MLTRIKEVEKFLDEFSIDEHVERLILIEKIEKGNNQSERGDIISEAEMDYEVRKWFE